MLPITHVIARTSLGTLGDGAGSWRACGTLNRMHRINTRKRSHGHTGRTCELLQRCWRWESAGDEPGRESRLVEASASMAASRSVCSHL